MCPCKAEETIDVRFVAPPMRNALILGNAMRLSLGEALLFVDDHDPKPVLYQLRNGFPSSFRWKYRAKGPDVWQICISRTAA
ncbi:MAG TPA: DUF2249 domain-containing protein [Ferrovibrio sp.]|jgi:uncharacterized protein (DUF2249 family)|uniref:DUF2249 domain-containing protein n=1 Tax=Ferrovibrio sp. TaxID=1917215 RepID=UPI002B4B2404|nr:DUF2249 domain-containing protein [Ferrovibrio sp.]HLT78709.1 DUF2249 domain-containing protein [Ferrovibrio sp.]